MLIQMTVSAYSQEFGMSRHGIHRRILKFINTQEPVNNIIDVRKYGPKIILLTIDPTIPYVLHAKKSRNSESK